MTTPIERGAEAQDRISEQYADELHAWGCTADPDEVAPAPPTPHEYARAVFESIDRDELARMLYRRDTPDDADFWDDGLPENFKRIWLLEADAIIAYLLGEQP